LFLFVFLTLSGVGSLFVNPAGSARCGPADFPQMAKRQVAIDRQVRSFYRKPSVQLW